MAQKTQLKGAEGEAIVNTAKQKLTFEALVATISATLRSHHFDKKDLAILSPSR
jgi:hypothetical protein